MTGCRWTCRSSTCRPAAPGCPTSSISNCRPGAQPSRRRLDRRQLRPGHGPDRLERSDEPRPPRRPAGTLRRTARPAATGRGDRHHAPAASGRHGGEHAAGKAAAERGEITLVDMRRSGPASWRGRLAADHFHPNELGYAGIADAFFEPVLRPGRPPAAHLTVRVESMASACCSTTPTARSAPAPRARPPRLRLPAVGVCALQSVDLAGTRRRCRYGPTREASLRSAGSGAAQLWARGGGHRAADLTAAAARSTGHGNRPCRAPGLSRIFGALYALIAAESAPTPRRDRAACKI